MGEFVLQAIRTVLSYYTTIYILEDTASPQLLPYLSS